MYDLVAGALRLLSGALRLLSGAVSSLILPDGTMRFSIFQAMATIVLIVAFILLAVYLPVLVRRLRGEPDDE
ncbi:hypothetical protein [Methylocella sp.]|uniref:hypothetical protein n=1 Tax=Methylocella sp. TaxID=1978226 RepID=UPI003783FD8D